MTDDGFSTLEATVAVALLALVAAGITSTLILAHRLQTTVAAERNAMQLAANGLERLRAGESAVTTATEDGFTVTESLQAWNGNARLFEARVRVTWEEASSRSVELWTLIVR